MADTPAPTPTDNEPPGMRAVYDAGGRRLVRFEWVAVTVPSDAELMAAIECDYLGDTTQSTRALIERLRAGVSPQPEISGLAADVERMLRLMDEWDAADGLQTPPETLREMADDMREAKRAVRARLTSRSPQPEIPAGAELHDTAAAHSQWLRWNGYVAPADCMDRLAELLVLATGRLGQPETVDGRDHGPGIDAQTVIAAYLANQGLVAVGEGWEQHCEDMAIDILSELRAAGLVYDGPQPEVTRQQIATTLASSAMACSSAGMRGVKAYEVQWLTEAVWALQADGATPADPDPAQCESCGDPATVTLPDGSTWCARCDTAARELGYDDGEADGA